MNTLSQCGKILRILKRRPSKGVKNWELARISLKYSSRLDELRKEGHNIYCERDYHKGRATNTSTYYLN